MKKLFFMIAATCSIIGAQAQTAQDFTATDCSGNSHNLYTELAAGKVVVLTWVMPCGSCVSGGNAAENAVESFAASHPGKIEFWLIDDFGDTPCGTLSSWASTNGITKPVIFGNAGNAIDENDFGGSGMPHVVVVSPDKKIAYNKKNGATNDQSGITTAINQGLTLSVAEINAANIHIAPNPTTNSVTISYNKGIKEVKVVAANGQIVLKEAYPASKVNPAIDLRALPTGVYQLLITDADGNRGVQQIVKQ